MRMAERIDLPTKGNFLRDSPKSNEPSSTIIISPTSPKKFRKKCTPVRVIPNLSPKNFNNAPVASRRITDGIFIYFAIILKRYDRITSALSVMSILFESAIVTKIRKRNDKFVEPGVLFVKEMLLLNL